MPILVPRASVSFGHVVSETEGSGSSNYRMSVILVPRAHDPSGLWQGSRALAWSNTGSPRFTDFSSNLIGREHETNALRILRKSGPARALEPCHRPEGSWALGTRMDVRKSQASGNACALLACLSAHAQKLILRGEERGI